MTSWQSLRHGPLGTADSGSSVAARIPPLTQSWTYHHPPYKGFVSPFIRWLSTLISPLSTAVPTRSRRSRPAPNDDPASTACRSRRSASSFLPLAGSSASISYRSTSFGTAVSSPSEVHNVGYTAIVAPLHTSDRRRAVSNSPSPRPRGRSRARQFRPRPMKTKPLHLPGGVQKLSAAACENRRRALCIPCASAIRPCVS